MTEKYLKSKQGVTLVELVITLAIFMLVSVMMYSILIYGSNSYSRGLDQYSVQSQIRIASDYMTDQIRYASEIEILGSLDPSIIGDPINAMEAYENYLLIYGDELIRISKYSDTSFTVGDNATLGFTSLELGGLLYAELSGEDQGQEYFIDSEIKPLNLSLHDGAIAGNTGSVIYYRTAEDYLAQNALPEAELGNPDNPNSVVINFSKGILNVPTFGDNQTTSTSTFQQLDSFHLEVNVSGGAAEGHEIIFVVELDDFGFYEYTLYYNGKWNIQ